jgi:hypothetical protein
VISTRDNERNSAWDEAVRIVDGRHNYTVEFAPDPDAHRAEYDAEYRRLRRGEAMDDDAR